MNLTPVHAKASVLVSGIFGFRVVSIFVLALMLQLSIVSLSQAASATFEAIPSFFGPKSTVPYSEAWGLSPNGSFVTGTAAASWEIYPENWASGVQSYRWSYEKGLESAGSPFSRGYGVNDYGDVVGKSYQTKHAFICFSVCGQYSGTHSLHGIPDSARSSSAFGISYIPRIVVGHTISDKFILEAFSWEYRTGYKGLGDLPGGEFYSSARNISSDGTTIVGHSKSALGMEAFRWTQKEGMKGLGDLSGGTFYSSALGTNTDGSVIVGRSHSVSGSEAFRWTKDEGMQGLGYINGMSGSFGGAFAVSEDGKIIVGEATGGAFIWDEANGMRSLKEVLETVYDLDLTGWGFRRATGISADGLTISGSCMSPSGNDHGFIVKLDFLPTAIINKSPIAHAGSDQTVSANTVVQLDASASTDPEGDYPLTYLWTLTPPAGSAAVLSDSTIAIPMFTTDVLGDYTVTLVVTDSKGKSSAPDTVVISTVNSAPTAAIAVPSGLAVIQHGTTVQLDGGGSTDPDGDALTFSWTLTPPTGSATTLINPIEIMPSFVPDVHGNYIVALTVTDPHGATDTTSVIITFDNIPPVASATYAEDGQVLIEGDTINLSGSGTDANLDAISTYTWALIAPAGSTAVLSNATAQNPSFVADIAGDYTLSLIVQDEHGLDSVSFTLSPITVLTQAQAVDNALTDLVTEITTLSPAVFDNANQQNALSNKLDAVYGLIDQGKYQQALGKLQNDILGKTDGCNGDPNGTPDGNDWINCAAQETVFPLVNDLIYFLS